MVLARVREGEGGVGYGGGESQTTTSTIHVKATVFHFLVPALVPLK